MTSMIACHIYEMVLFIHRSLDDDKLNFVPDPARPKRTIDMILRNFVLAHGWWHLGEIKYLKGLQRRPAGR